MKKEEQYMELPFKVGDVFKNYKALCKVLGEKQRTGNARNSQLKRWEEHFLWRKEGHKMIITEIIELKYPTHDNNQLGKSTKEYSKYLQRIILFLLYTKHKESGDFRTYVSRRGIALFAEMVRQEFFYATQNKNKNKKTRKKLIDDTKEIKDVLDLLLGRVDQTITNDINTALSQLKQKMLIEYRTVNMVVEGYYFKNGIYYDKIPKIKEYLGDDDLFEKYFEYRGISTKEESGQPEKWSYNIRVASEVEEAIIVHTRKEVLKEMGYFDERDLYVRGEPSEFYKKVNDYLKEYFDIEATFKNYAIYFSPYFVKEALLTNVDELKLHEAEFEALKDLLNQGFSDYLRESIKKYYYNAKKQEEINLPEGIIYQNPKGYKELTYNQELILLSGSVEGTLDYIIENLILRE